MSSDPGSISPNSAQKDDSSRQLALRVDSLSKVYQIYARPQDRLKQALFRGKRTYFQAFTALDDVSFEIKRGETVGILGRNGSGKSTLLQIIAGTLTQTGGEVERGGRVAALLELGAGFNPEFSGAENAKLNAAILGLTAEEVEEVYPRIVEFADIGPFIDQPVKTYSSGMYVRLAFATAIAVDPDILIVDEALSVGDEAFQRKCFARIHQIQEQGGTILFVSHSAGSVIELCNRAFLMDQGHLLLSDTPKSVVGFYSRLLYDTGTERQSILNDIEARRVTLAEQKDNPVGPVVAEGEIAGEIDPNADDADETEGKPDAALEAYYDPNLISKSRQEYGSRGAQIHEPRVETLDGRPVNVLRRGERYAYAFRVQFSEPMEKLRFGMFIRTRTGLDLGGASSFPPSRMMPSVEAGKTVLVRFEFDCLMMPDVYFMNAGASAVIDGERTFVHRIVDGVMIRVMAEADMTAAGLVDFRITPHVRLDQPE
jgi:lipopolysaccharide transport system ATP-binding protein